MKMRTIFFLILFANLSIATNIDSLYNVLKSTSNKQQLIDTYTEIASYYRSRKPDSTLKYAGIINRLAQELNDSSKLALSHKLQGDAYIYLSNFPKSEKEYKTAIGIYQKLSDKESIDKINNNLGVVYQFSGQYDKAVELYKLSLDAAVKSGDKPGISKSYNNLGSLYTKMGKTDEAIDCLKKSLEIKKELSDSMGIAKAYHNLGALYFSQNKYTEAVDYYEKSQQIKRAINDSLYMSVTLANLGLAYKKIFDYEKAIKYLYDAMDFAQKTNNKKQLADIYNIIAATYDEYGSKDTSNKYFQEKVIEFYNKALAICELSKDYEGLVNTINNIGTYYVEEKKYDEALTQFLKGLRFAQIKNLPTKECALYNNLADVYLKKQEYNEAKFYINKALSILEKHPDKESEIASYDKLSEIYLKTNNIDLAEKYALKALKITEEINLGNVKRNIYKRLSLIYDKKGDYKKAFLYHTKYTTLNDSIFSNNTKDMLLTLQAKYKTKEQQQQIKLLDTQNKLKETALNAEKLKLKQQRLMSVGLSVIVIIVLIFAIMLRKQIKAKIRANNLLKDKNEEITTQKEEIEHQFKIIKKQNTEITDSINYARLIQEALLPSNEILSNNFKDFFIFYKPKSIVSGDFYWVSKYENKIIVAAVDCTGHGVPGAFMSMLGISFLNDIVAENKMLNAGKILDLLREKVIKSLKQTEDDSSQKDGMDISLAVIDKINNEIEFAGAYNPLFLIRKTKNENLLHDFDNEKAVNYKDFTLLEIKADRMPISISRKNNNFSTIKFQYLEGDRIFMFSDGYIDQFHHKTFKKFKKNNFKKLLLENSDKKLQDYTKILDDKLQEWKAGSEQTDDIIVIGIEL